jgi:DNA excision repair protein ERCC-3
MSLKEQGPLIVMKDGKMLLETQHPMFEHAREDLSAFAELCKSPGYVQTYQMTPISLWNAAAAGMKSEEILHILFKYAKNEVSQPLQMEIKQCIGNYGTFELRMMGEELLLISNQQEALHSLLQKELTVPFFSGRNERQLQGESGSPIFGVPIAAVDRGRLKQVLTTLGYPIVDMAGFRQGEQLPAVLQAELRDYQAEAVHAYCDGVRSSAGSGVLVLPCGSGKTVIGIAALTRLECATLILTTNVTSVRQWRDELLRKTNLREEDIGEYDGTRKVVRPVTIATYSILTHRKNKEGLFPHMKLFNERDWGLIIYDEVHALPAPVFRVTADIQATRRLGLTATLVREDGRQTDVFSLIGPKLYEMPWKRLEQSGWISRVSCHEIRVGMSALLRQKYVQAKLQDQHRLAGENPMKIEAVHRLLALHPGEPTLIIGQYLHQLRSIAESLGSPMISGETPHEEREKWYALFKSGDIKLLVVSKVANFAVDLPDASVAVQVSGSFGSRQEEAQRIGRLLRPKAGGNTAAFYSIVSKDTSEEHFALHRQLFLVEQGYEYDIQDWASVQGYAEL